MSGPELDPGEEVVVDVTANRSQGGRAVGGRFFLTTTHVRFRPHGFDRATGGDTWARPRNEVTAVDVAPRALADGPFSGGLRRRLRLRLSDGSEEHFVVNRVAAKVDRLRGELGLG